MKKINTLNKKLESLNNKLQEFPPLSDISTSQFITYKKITAEKEKVKKQLKKSMLYAKSTISWYDNYEKQQLNNIKINCRQYYRRQQNAEYKRNLVLYRLGLMNQRPIRPILRPILELTSKLLEPVSKSITSFYEKFKNFKSVVIPQKLNNMAIQTATLGIRGYKTLKSNCIYMRNQMELDSHVQYVKSIMQQAKQQFDTKSNNAQSACSPENQRAKIIKTTYGNVPIRTTFDPTIQRKNIAHIEYTL